MEKQAGQDLGRLSSQAPTSCLKARLSYSRPTTPIRRACIDTSQSTQRRAASEAVLGSCAPPPFSVPASRLCSHASDLSRAGASLQPRTALACLSGRVYTHQSHSAQVIQSWGSRERTWAPVHHGQPCQGRRHQATKIAACLSLSGTASTAGNARSASTGPCRCCMPSQPTQAAWNPVLLRGAVARFPPSE